MNTSPAHDWIVQPGQAIGPLTLGMTRTQVCVEIGIPLTRAYAEPLPDWTTLCLNLSPSFPCYTCGVATVTCNEVAIVSAIEIRGYPLLWNDMALFLEPYHRIKKYSEERFNDVREDENGLCSLEGGIAILAQPTQAHLPPESVMIFSKYYFYRLKKEADLQRKVSIEATSPTGEPAQDPLSLGEFTLPRTGTFKN